MGFFREEEYPTYTRSRALAVRTLNKVSSILTSIFCMQGLFHLGCIPQAEWDRVFHGLPVPLRPHPPGTRDSLYISIVQGPKNLFDTILGVPDSDYTEKDPQNPILTLRPLSYMGLIFAVEELDLKKTLAAPFSDLSCSSFTQRLQYPLIEEYT